MYVNYGNSYGQLPRCLNDYRRTLAGLRPDLKRPADELDALLHARQPQLALLG